MYRASYFNVLITNKMHNSYNQFFLFHSRADKKLWNKKIDYKNCASRWLTHHLLQLHYWIIIDVTDINCVM